MKIKEIAPVLLSALLVLAALGYSSGSAQARTEGCYLLHPDMTLSAECPEIFFTWGWAAMTRGQINEFVGAVQDSVTLRDGKGNVLQTFTPAQLAQTWGPAYPVDPAELGVECGMPAAWVSDSFVSFGSLTPGKYTITIERAFSHPLTDGFNACWAEGYKIPVSLYREGGIFTAGFTVR